MKRFFRDDTINNVLLLSILSFLEALQLLIVVAFIFSFIPIKPAGFVQQLFPISLYDVRPEREMEFYRLWVFTAILCQGILVYIFRKRISDARLRAQVYPFILVSAFWIFIQVFAVFKILLWTAPFWAKVLLWFGLAGAAFSKIFWPELKRWGASIYAYLGRKMFGAPSILFDMTFLGGLFVLLWPKDMGFVLGRMFVRDQFYHLDSILMSPGLAHLNGLALNGDVISQYSVSLPILISEILKHMGGFNYLSAVGLIIGIGILYYMALYFLLKEWLGSRAIAAFGVLLAVKLQMFHWGVAPLIWQFPSATSLRHWPDMIFFFCLLMHIRTSRKMWLVATVLTTSFALGWMMDVGVYLLASLLVYIAIFGLQQRQSLTRVLKLLIGVFTLTVSIAFILLWILQPQAVFHAWFWRNTFEFASLFVQGWGALPMTNGLQEKQFFAYIMGFAIPIVYVFTLIYVGTLCILRKIDFKNIFVAILCVYGLCLYHYFINRSGVTSYYAVCIPLVMVISFWINHALGVFSISLRRMFKVALAAMALGALVTSYWFTYYPNALNLNGLDWKQEKNFYVSAFDFSADAALIKRLTPPNDAVALLSSFETRILMQAERKPLFYYFPMMESSLMNAPPRGTYLHTYARLKRTIEQLEARKPNYVFIEKKLLGRREQQGLGALLDYTDLNYTLAAEGRYLVAYRRKDK